MNLVKNCWSVKLFLSCEINKYFSTVLFNKNENVEVVKYLENSLKRGLLKSYPSNILYPKLFYH